MRARKLAAPVIMDTSKVNAEPAMSLAKSASTVLKTTSVNLAKRAISFRVSLLLVTSKVLYYCGSICI